jgi:hypothetical protein
MVYLGLREVAQSMSQEGTSRERVSNVRIAAIKAKTRFLAKAEKATSRK